MGLPQKQPTWNDAGSFEERLKGRIEALPGGKDESKSSEVDRGALEVAHRFFSAGDELDLRYIDDEGELQQLTVKSRHVRFAQVLPLIYNLIGEALKSNKGEDINEASVAVSLFSMAAVEDSPISNAAADLVDKIYGLESGRRILLELDSESFMHTLEVVMDIFPLGRLVASFSHAMKRVVAERD